MSALADAVAAMDREAVSDQHHDADRGAVPPMAGDAVARVDADLLSLLG